MSEHEQDPIAGSPRLSRRWLLKALLVAPLVAAPAIEAAAQEFSPDQQGFLRDIGRGINRGVRNLGIGARPQRSRRPARSAAPRATRRNAAPRSSGGGKSAPKFAD